MKRPGSARNHAPWYKVRVVWFTLAMFAVLVVASVITIYLAGEDFDGAVATEYVKKDLAVQVATHKSERARVLGLQAMAFMDHRKNEILVQVSPVLSVPQLKLGIIHPTREAEDQHILLKLEGEGRYRGAFSAMTSEHGNLQLQDIDETWQMEGQWHAHDEKIQLTASAS
jgi:hypothetical protein